MNQYYDNMKAYLKLIDETIENGEYKADWSTLINHKVPDWYRDAKFGIFIHWGVYSVPAYGHEWYARHVYQQDYEKGGLNFYKHHTEKYGPLKDFGYKDFVPMFQAQNFDPDAWADLFHEAGAKFVMPVAEHHDGFQMYDSQLSPWCATQMGPKKDIVGLLKEAVEKRDMTLTTSSHRVEHFWFMGEGRKFHSDITDDIEFGHMYWPSNPIIQVENGEHTNVYVKDDAIDPIFMEDWLVRTCEIVDKYRPKIMYFDWWIQVAPMKPYLKKFAAYYYNRAKEWGQEVTINHKNDAFMHTVAVKDIERGQLSGISPWFWQNDTAVAKNSWCYTENNDFKEPVEIICDLIDVVSKNGSLLLNIGPKADGTISEDDTRILKEIGKWMSINGEAIYGTYPWRHYGEGPTETLEGHFTDTLRKPFTSEDFRFTFKEESLYAIAMKWPEDGTVILHEVGKEYGRLKTAIKRVSILGYDTDPLYETRNAIEIYANTIKVNHDLPVVIKIEIM